ncbi:MAG TPA: DUF4139 domain-containing protein [Fimbriimonadaceae bacterium]|nr:DUF4139 domain-containing protein [Fimbriimonadaceae bacterium]
MNKQSMGLLAGVALCGVCAIQGCGRAAADNERAPKAQPRDIQLTIYKEDFALVHENRPVDLGDGPNQIRLENVSKTLDPNSVIFDWGNEAKPPEVTSQVYDLGMTSGSLLKRLEGKPVEMLWNTQDGKPKDQIDGTLESVQDGGFVIRSGDRLYINPNGTIVASSEQNVAMTPQLSVQVDSPSKENATLGFAYQTRGMSWSADYVGRLSPDGDAMNLECWATLENRTGIDYPNAKITLVAGSPNRAVSTPAAAGVVNGDFERQEGKLTWSGAGRLGGGAMPSEAVGELYAYKVPAPANVGEEQMNRVKMLSSATVPIKRDYSIRIDNAGYYDYPYYASNPQRQNAQLAISLVNDDKSGLGMPLPAGAVRIYDQTSSDATAFVGAAGMGDTPKNQHVDLTLSKVFDVYAESRSVAPDKRIDRRTIRKSFETVIHNEKKAAVDVRVVETLYGKKHLVSESVKGVQINVVTRQWNVHVDAGGQATLAWTADFGN